jgi:hypothetical protein
MKVRLDLNNPDFQKEWFSLEKEDFTASKGTLKKMVMMDWNQVYHDRGLKWEKIQSIKTDKGRELYTIRLSKKQRAVVYRQNEFMIFVSLHPDHDSAYKTT